MKANSRGVTVCALGLNLALPVALASVLFLGVEGSPTAEAKTPGSTYCYYGKCHRVKSIAETEALIGSDETLSSSFYDDCKKDSLNPCGLTSSGERFRPEASDNAASPIYPDGTILLVWSPETKEAAVIRVNNAGPYWGNRKLDVSVGTAERLGFKGRGVADLQVRVIDAPEAAEATYKKYRTYDRVPGSIGQFDSLDTAHAGMAAVMGLEAIASSTMAPLVGGAIAAARSEEAGEPRPVAVASADTASKPVTTSKPAATAVGSEPEKTPATIAVAKVEPKAEPVKVVAEVKVAEANVEKRSETRRAEKASRKEKAAASKKRANEVRVASKKGSPNRAARVAAAKASQRMAMDRKRGSPVASAKPEGKAGMLGPNDISVFSRYSRYNKV